MGSISWRGVARATGSRISDRPLATPILGCNSVSTCSRIMWRGNVPLDLGASRTERLHHDDTRQHREKRQNSTGRCRDRGGPCETANVSVDLGVARATRFGERGLCSIPAPPTRHPPVEYSGKQSGSPRQVGANMPGDDLATWSTYASSRKVALSNVSTNAHRALHAQCIPGF